MKASGMPIERRIIWYKPKLSWWRIFRINDDIFETKQNKFFKIFAWIINLLLTLDLNLIMNRIFVFVSDENSLFYWKIENQFKKFEFDHTFPVYF
jgi:hypothetical protein